MNQEETHKGFEKSIADTRAMREKRIQRDRKMCFGKSRYPTESTANRYKKKAENMRDVKLRVYCCPVCMGYHLTSKVDKDQPS